MNTHQETAEQAVKRVLAARVEHDAAEQAQFQKLRDEAEKAAAAKEKERTAAEQAKADRLREQQAERFDGDHKTGALAAWRATGGDAKSFVEAWPAMRAELQVNAVRRLQQQARANNAALYREF